MTDFCTCNPPEPDGARVPGCVKCGKILSPAGGNSVNISDEELKFARKIIGQCQQVILKHQQMIDDIRRQYGLKP